jgi:hypothetical protein
MNKYQQEAKDRWGNTEAYKQSLASTKNWTEADYANAVKDTDAFHRCLAETMDKGVTSPQFQALMAKHHQSINKFYDCSLDMLRSLADMYITDSRFTHTYDKYKSGLAQAVHDGLVYYCDHYQK